MSSGRAYDVEKAATATASAAAPVLVVARSGVAAAACRLSVRETVAVQADGSRKVDLEEEFADGSRQITSIVYPAGVPVPSASEAVVQQQLQQSTAAGGSGSGSGGNNNVVYAPPLAPPPYVDRGPCGGGRGCLIFGSVAATVGAAVFCFWPVILMWVALIFAAAPGDDHDDHDDD